MIALFVIDSAEAQSHSGVLILDSIPSKVTAGDTVVFSGQLRTTSNYIIPDAKIYIKDDVTFGKDKILRQTTTDSNGEFYTTWTAKSRSSGAWDIYAVFEGSSIVSKTKSSEYSVKVSSSYSSSSSGQQGSQNHSDSNSFDTQIVLRGIPSSTYIDELVTIEGKLTANGKPLSGKTIMIKDDDSGLDDLISTVSTNQYGEFSSTVRAQDWDTLGTNVEIYAVFEGTSTYDKSRSETYSMLIKEKQKYSGRIILDGIPKSVKIGDRLTFSGTLYLQNSDTKGAVVYIKDEDTARRDDLLATAYVHQNGKFSVEWIVRNVDPPGGRNAEIFAVFEGDNTHKRLATNEESLKILKYVPKPSQTPEPMPKTSNNGYMKLYYSKDLSTNPHVAIILASDSDIVYNHISSVKKGINTWTRYMEHNYGGNWDVTYEIIDKNSRFVKEPDVMVNLITPKEKEFCEVDWGGFARYDKSKQTQTWVCASNAKRTFLPEEVMAISAHEFIHAMGLGHTFDKKGDLMCSKERNSKTGEWIPTCEYGKKSKTPSWINLEAIRAMYGDDGFSSPNNNVMSGKKFFINGQNPTVKDTVQHTEPKCVNTNTKYDIEVNKPLKPGYYRWWELCTNTIQYSFTTNSEDDGFRMFLLPPETNIKDFMKNRIGKYYPCEKYEQGWNSKSGKCNIKPGSALVIKNYEENTIMLSGYIRN